MDILHWLNTPETRPKPLDGGGNVGLLGVKRGHEAWTYSDGSKNRGRQETKVHATRGGANENIANPSV